MQEGSIILPRAKLAQLEGDVELLGFFVELVQRARFKAGVAPDGSPLNPGQLVTGKRHLAALTKQTESWCFRALRRLQTRTLIELEANRLGTVVTIVDWPGYASFSGAPRTAIEPKTNRSRTEVEPKVNQNRTPKKKEGKKKEEKKPPPPAPSAANCALTSWVEVEAELKKCGVSAVAGAVGAAQRNGLSLEAATEIVAEYHAKRGAWSPGALHGRFNGSLSAWPPPVEGYRPPPDEKLRAEIKRIEQLPDLESKLGQKFDRLPAPERARHFSGVHGSLNVQVQRKAAIANYAEDLQLKNTG